ncbi:TolB family protein [Schumannella soli]|uniref:TolB family protein n=1 Tax=Schumannella soli TaxID=2590779 RepID=UPI0021085D10|nr:biopolymer transporter Tol [Schumannella soli]
MSPRRLAPGQVARIHVHDIASGADAVVHESREVLFEAPNWAGEADGGVLLLNGDGVLWSLMPEPGSTAQRIAHENLPPINNDHVLDPRGGAIFLSADDGHIHRAPIAGGRAERVTSEPGVHHFLHGVSPDGERLAFVRMRDFSEPGRLAIVASEPGGRGDGAGGGTTIVDTGPGHLDGPEWSPDGAWISFNSERWARRPGHAQLARIPDPLARANAAGDEAHPVGPDDVERLLATDTVDWFPHLAPDGRHAVYLEFPPGTTGHPADLEVTLVVVDTADWSTPLARIPLPGGQGTINVPSWAPDSGRFAYVSYPCA